MFDEQTKTLLFVLAIAWLVQLPCLWYAVARRRKGKPRRSMDFLILFLPLIGVSLATGGAGVIMLFSWLSLNTGYWVLLLFLPMLAGGVALPFIEPGAVPPDAWQKKWLDK